MPNSKIFVAKVNGEYIAERGRDRVLRSYEAIFRLPNADAPLSMIRGKLLMPFLRKLDSAVVAPYSWNLQELAPEDGVFNPDEIPVMFQSLPQLEIYCKKHRLPVPVSEYADVEMCRAHVILAEDDVQAFHRVFAKYKTRIDEDRELTELNRNFENIGRVGTDVSVDYESGKVVPKQTAPQVAAAGDGGGEATDNVEKSIFE